MDNKSNEFTKRSGPVTGRFEQFMYAIAQKMTPQVPTATVHMNRARLEWLLEDAPENINGTILERTFQKDPQLAASLLWFKYLQKMRLVLPLQALSCLRLIPASSR